MKRTGIIVYKYMLYKKAHIHYILFIKQIDHCVIFLFKKQNKSKQSIFLFDVWERCMVFL